jgi:hypothetical protein
LKQQPRNASIIATTPTVTKYLGTAAFAAFVQEDSRWVTIMLH